MSHSPPSLDVKGYSVSCWDAAAIQRTMGIHRPEWRVERSGADGRNRTDTPLGTAT